ncbi:MAG: hypothetical protein ACI9SJ_000670 [Flavobacteriaceae bacterium]|uniref:DUF6787 family protein n=1 Tax=Candidatus Marifrigoribacter sp. Uisw_064 TaxID=3230970 RepID=UPI003AEED311
MNTFKNQWDIKSNWQLIFPVLGLIGLIYSSYKLSNLFVKDSMLFKVISTLVLSIVLLKFTLFLFTKLEKKWELEYRWEMIRVFIVFAITGTSSVFVGKPIIKLLGITKDNLHPSVYWVLYILIGFIFYQILLLLIGWIFGQFNFFWSFEKRMMRKMKIGFLLKDEE